MKNMIKELKELYEKNNERTQIPGSSERWAFFLECYIGMLEDQTPPLLPWLNEAPSKLWFNRILERFEDIYCRGVRK